MPRMCPAIVLSEGRREPILVADAPSQYRMVRTTKAGRRLDQSVKHLLQFKVERLMAFRPAAVAASRWWASPSWRSPHKFCGQLLHCCACSP